MSNKKIRISLLQIEGGILFSLDIVKNPIKRGVLLPDSRYEPGMRNSRTFQMAFYF
jgi:hypothetical protein